MINLKEIRLDNWIWDNIDKKVKKPINHEGLWNIGEYPTNGDYIKITRKIIDKFLVNKFDVYHFIYKIEEHYEFELLFEFYSDSNNFYLSTHEEDQLIFCGERIEYLHQLQNIIYYLTKTELNDIVAYNYYLKLHKKVTGFDGSISLSKFIEILNDGTLEDKQRTSICEKMPEYKLGDLPPDLFKDYVHE